MRKTALLLLSFLLSSGCASRIAGFRKPTLEQWFVPAVAEAQRPAVPFDSVVFLDQFPTNRHYEVIGYILPPPRDFDSMARMLNATRAAASLYGANAIIVSAGDKENVSGWSFSGGAMAARGKSWESAQIKASVLVWKQ
jgi:hypothetical protein